MPLVSRTGWFESLTLAACDLLVACDFMRPGPGARTADAVALLPANDLIRIPRGNSFLVFTITNIFNVLVPASSAVSALAALSRRRAAGASIGNHGRAVAPGVASGSVYLRSG